MTLKFEPGLDFLTVHLSTKFHHPRFISSDVLTNSKQRDSVGSTHIALLCYPGGKNGDGIVNAVSIVNRHRYVCAHNCPQQCQHLPCWYQSVKLL